MQTRTVGLGTIFFLLLGAIFLIQPPIMTQASFPNATHSFNGWLAVNGGNAQVPYDSEISLDPSISSFTLEGWINSPTFGYGNSSSWDVVSKLSSFSLKTGHTYLLGFPGTNTYYVTLMRNGVGTLHTGSSCSEWDSCMPTGWFHFAYVYDKPNNKWMFFWNGVKLDEVIQTPLTSTQPLVLKYAQKMDEFRISNNVRYSANFTVPSDPFTCDANTLALWHWDEVQNSTTFHDSCGATDNVMTGASGAHTEGVTAQNTNTVLVSSPNPSIISQSVTLTATVSITPTGSEIPTGSITFKDGATPLITTTLSNGIATYITSTLVVGSHTLSAVYNADPAFVMSTSPDLVHIVESIIYRLYLPSILR
ncbi:MAG: Ig-like domain repeat protein [Chloroflexi bacterium]|nr:Ig-like domain repeat protein [Chloroflexota bacterium]